MVGTGGQNLAYIVQEYGDGSDSLEIPSINRRLVY